MEVTVAGLAADITKLVADVATAAGSNHDYSQTAELFSKGRPRGLTAEITARASSQLFSGTSCAGPGEGFERLREPGQPGRPH